MDNLKQRFWLYAFAIIAIIGAIGGLIGYGSIAFFLFLILAWGVTVSTFIWLTQKAFGSPQKFVNTAMAAIGIKMFGSLLALFIYGLFAPKSHIVPVFIGYLLAYLSLTALEVRFLLLYLSQKPKAIAPQKIVVVSVKCSPEQAEMLIPELAEQGFDSFLENEEGFEAAQPAADFDVKQINAIISAHKASFSFTEIEDQNWNALWESQIKPLVVDEQLYIRADFHAPDPSYPLELIITPKMAFGSGHHQTTYMMCQFLLEADLNGKEVLDAGCGTGILSILAKKRGASRVVGVDIEEWAIQNALENAIINDVILEVHKGTSKTVTGQFDCIFANITLNAIVDELDQYSRLLRNNGEFYASGFFIADIGYLEQQAGKHGFIKKSEKRRDNWAAIKFVKKF